MLVLTRKVGECIKVGPDIWITVVGVDRGHVRLGITAPLEVNISRTELLEVDRRSDAQDK